MSDLLKNTINARSIYFASLLSDNDRRSLPERANNPDISREKYDEYLDVFFRKHLANQIKVAVTEAKSYAQKAKTDSSDEKSFHKRVEKNCELYSSRRKELEEYIKSLDDKDDWERKEGDLADKFAILRQLAEADDNEECASPKMSDSDKVERNIEKTKAKADKLAEISRSLLLGADIDYLQNLEACNILLNEE